MNQTFLFVPVLAVSRNIRLAMRSFLASVGWILLISSLCASGLYGQSLPAEVLVNPKATYLRTSSDSAAAPTPIDLASIGVSAGDILRLTSLGYFNNGIGNLSTGMIGVFSSNSVLLAQTQTNRVPGAIAAGVPYTSGATYYSSLPTDIPQDFFIQRTNISVRVPVGAAYLFVSASDSLFQDNIDITTNHFRVWIDLGTETVLSITNLTAGSLGVYWNSDSNQWYQLESSLPSTGGWASLGTPVAGTGATVGVTNLIAGSGAMLYRAKRVP